MQLSNLNLLYSSCFFVCLLACLLACLFACFLDCLCVCRMARNASVRPNCSPQHTSRNFMKSGHPAFSHCLFTPLLAYLLVCLCCLLVCLLVFLIVCVFVEWPETQASAPIARLNTRVGIL